MDNLEKKCQCGNEECTCDDNCNCTDEHCDCSRGEHEPLIIEMEDVNGEKVKVQVVGTFDDNGKSYAIVNDLDNEENSYIFEVQSTEQGDMLVSIDDEKEFDRLCSVIEKLTSEN